MNLNKQLPLPACNLSRNDLEWLFSVLVQQGPGNIKGEWTNGNQTPSYPLIWTEFDDDSSARLLDKAEAIWGMMLTTLAEYKALIAHTTVPHLKIYQGNQNHSDGKSWYVDLDGPDGAGDSGERFATLEAAAIAVPRLMRECIAQFTPPATVIIYSKRVYNKDENTQTWVLKPDQDPMQFILAKVGELALKHGNVDVSWYVTGRELRVHETSDQQSFYHRFAITPDLKGEVPGFGE